MKVDLDKWHHCDVDKEEFVKLLKKSDYQGFKHMFIFFGSLIVFGVLAYICLLYTSPSPRDFEASRMPSSA